MGNSKESHFATVLMRDHPELGAVRMSARDVRHQLGSSNGGLKGKGHRWTKLQAQKAAKKSRRSHRHNRQHIRRVKGRLDRPALRLRYASVCGVHTLSSIFYNEGNWYQTVTTAVKKFRRGESKPYYVFVTEDVRLSERTALRRLGYLPYPLGRRVPRVVLAARPGTPLAEMIGQEVSET